MVTRISTIAAISAADVQFEVGKLDEAAQDGLAVVAVLVAADDDEVAMGAALLLFCLHIILR